MPSIASPTTADKWEEVLFPVAAHSALGWLSVGTIGLAFKVSGHANQFYAAFFNRIVNSNVLDEEFTQKFLKKSVSQSFRILTIQLPLVPVIRLFGTTQRADALGQSFLNMGLKILSFSSLLKKIALVATAALCVSTSLQLIIQGGEYNWSKWEERWEQHRTGIIIHSFVLLGLALLTFRIPIFKDR